MQTPLPKYGKVALFFAPDRNISHSLQTESIGKALTQK